MYMLLGIVVFLAIAVFAFAVIFGAIIIIIMVVRKMSQQNR
jgi:hypothetical protein